MARFVNKWLHFIKSDDVFLRRTQLQRSSLFTKWSAFYIQNHSLPPNTEQKTSTTTFELYWNLVIMRLFNECLENKKDFICADGRPVIILKGQSFGLEFKSHDLFLVRLNGFNWKLNKCARRDTNKLQTTRFYQMDLLLV